MVEEKSQLKVRTLQTTDAQELFDRLQDFSVAKWLCSLPVPYTLEDATKYINGGGGADWRLCITLNDSLIGGIGIKPLEDNPDKSELGYWLSAKYWGNGYTTKSVASTLDAYEKSHPELEVISFVQLGNTASMRVMEKLGFKEWDPVHYTCFWSKPFKSHVELIQYRRQPS